MIISASRRTDIPAFYAEWLMNHIRAGFCQTANPFNPAQVARISLLPQDVEAIVFWTRYPRPLLPYLAELDERGYRYYFQFTLTGYPRELEPRLPERSILIQSFRDLASHVGAQRVIWRYDPIVLSSITDIPFHERNFAELAEALSGLTRRVVVSLLDPYTKNRRRLRKLAESGVVVQDIQEIDDRLGGLLCSLAGLARTHGLEITSCAEPWDLRPYGIAPGKCVDDEYIARVLGVVVTHAKDRAQRPACGCVQSKDIGAYDSCRYGCVYCYATSDRVDPDAVRARYDPDALFLTG